MEMLTSHYVNSGSSEGRSKDSFDEYGYIASYSDLITTFGTDIASAKKHHITSGYSEGRSVPSMLHHTMPTQI